MHDARQEAKEDAGATAASPFSEAGFRALAARALHKRAPIGPSRPEEPLSPSDFDLNPEHCAELAAHPAPRPAAVLVPIVARAGLTVLLTQRTDSLPSHAGQIAFPGGKMEADDQDPIATALREAREEIGLDPRFVETLGYLDAYRTGTGYRIFPVVALIRDGFELALDANEVADAFEVPLAFLMDERNHETHVRSWRGAERRFYAIPFQQRYIWGATAGIMKNMHQRLFSA
jgi:8-oxo-dGTP pyrophosphatase MutT (NUDIX family)